MSALIPGLGDSLFLVGYPISLLLAPGASALKVGSFPLHVGALIPGLGASLFLVGYPIAQLLALSAFNFHIT
ncbi:hypothetical protein Q75_01920 [Bacillus coahuilensis p1.1.43]|uniref:Uncharacterized protein n=1 Tax=Bacillus coahuilensis p1.1.43 TaxID=1150625 RepID=A0A147KBT2_9BACI|nr:hypothetical protein Q75_01920 [Bacillus coahuilensis p1.1.43]